MKFWSVFPTVSVLEPVPSSLVGIGGLSFIQLVRGTTCMRLNKPWKLPDSSNLASLFVLDMTRNNADVVTPSAQIPYLLAWLRPSG